MARKWTILTVLGICWTSPETATAQSPADSVIVRGLVSGQILDASSGTALAGAQVTITADPEGIVSVSRARSETRESSPFQRLSETAVTQSDGVYRFEGLPDGRFEMRVRRLGYRPATLVVDLRDAATVSMSVGMTMVPIRLEPTGVTASAPTDIRLGRVTDMLRDSSSVQTVRRRQREFLEPDVRALSTRDLTESATLGDGDLFRALSSLPGVHLAGDQTAELWVRGAPFEQTSVQWDGLPIYNAFTNGVRNAAVNADLIGSAHLHSGPRPASVAGGTAAVLNVLSRPASGTGDMRGTAEMGRMLRMSIEQRALDGRVGWLVGGRWNVSEGATRPWSADLSGRFDISIDGERTIDVSGLSTWERWGRYAGLLGLPDNAAKWRNRAGRVAFRSPVAGMRATVYAGASGYTATVTEEPDDGSDLDGSTPVIGPINQPATSADLRYLTVGTTFAPTRLLGEVAPWRLGLAYVRQDVIYSGPIPVISPLERPSSSFSKGGNLDYVSAWALRRWSLAPWTFEVSARADIGEWSGTTLDGQSELTGGLLNVAPHASVRFAVSPSFTLSASASRSYEYTQGLGGTGSLSGQDERRLSRAWVLAGPDVPAVRSDIASIGAEHWFGETWLAGVSAFHRRSTGLIVPDPRLGPIADQRPYVEGSDRGHGFEFSLRRLAGRWTTSLGYSYVVTQRRANGLEHPGAADVRHVAEAGGTFRLFRPLLVGFNTIATSGVPLTRVFACTYDDDCPADWEATDEPYTLRTTALMETNIFVDWSHRFSAWDLGAFLRFTNIFGHSNRWSYLGTVEGCASRFTLPCAPGQEQTDILLPQSHSGIGTLGVRIAF